MDPPQRVSSNIYRDYWSGGSSTDSHLSPSGYWWMYFCLSNTGHVQQCLHLPLHECGQGLLDMGPEWQLFVYKLHKYFLYQSGIYWIDMAWAVLRRAGDLWHDRLWSYWIRSRWVCHPSPRSTALCFGPERTLSVHRYVSWPGVWVMEKSTHLDQISELEDQACENRVH